jgi:peptidoglycan hydrolase-like amidase
MKPLIDRGIRKAAARLAGAVLLACLLAPSPASADTTWTMTGHGFGHGVGLSQYGAYGYALHGMDYRFMLAHYYQGTTIGTAPPGRVRVLLTIARGDVTFKKATSACGRTLNPTRSYRAHLNGGAVQLLSDHRGTLANCGAKLRATGKGRVRIRGNGAYRGALVVVPASGGGSLNVVNAISVDKYVQGVIAGEVVMYGGEIARTYYSASSGGQTESVQFGFPGSAPVPYLVGVDDPYDTTSPLHTWRKTFTQGQIEARLGGYLKGNLQDIQITKTGVSPRIVSADVVGSGGTTKVSGSQLQTALGGYSTWMTFSHGGAGPPTGSGGSGGNTGGGQPSG